MDVTPAAPLPDDAVVPGAGDAAQTAAPPTAPDSHELEPQLKYERLGADVRAILQDASATCLALSEKVVALGTSAGNVHVLDYSGNEVRVCCCARCVWGCAWWCGETVATVSKPAGK
jgi:hypothetical protein